MSAKITKERQEYIKKIFEQDAKLVIDELIVNINKLEYRYMCIPRAKIVKYLQKRVK